MTIKEKMEVKMVKIRIELEFDEKILGLNQMNSNNFDTLLYSKEFTRKDLLKVLSYKKLKDSNKKIRR